MNVSKPFFLLLAGLSTCGVTSCDRGREAAEIQRLRESTASLQAERAALTEELSGLKNRLREMERAGDLKSLREMKEEESRQLEENERLSVVAEGLAREVDALTKDYENWRARFAGR